MLRSKRSLTQLQAKALAWFAAGNNCLFMDRGPAKGHWRSTPFNGGVMRWLEKKFYIAGDQFMGSQIRYSITALGEQVAQDLLDKRIGPRGPSFTADTELPKR